MPSTEEEQEFQSEKNPEQQKNPAKEKKYRKVVRRRRASVFQPDSAPVSSAASRAASPDLVMGGHSRPRARSMGASPAFLLADTSIEQKTQDRRSPPFKKNGLLSARKRGNSVGTVAKKPVTQKDELSASEGELGSEPDGRESLQTEGVTPVLRARAEGVRARYHPPSQEKPAHADESWVVEAETPGSSQEKRLCSFRGVQGKSAPELLSPRYWSFQRAFLERQFARRLEEESRQLMVGTDSSDEEPRSSEEGRLHEDTPGHSGPKPG